MSDLYTTQPFAGRSFLQPTAAVSTIQVMPTFVVNRTVIPQFQSQRSAISNRGRLGYAAPTNAINQGLKQKYFALMTS